MKALYVLQTGAEPALALGQFPVPSPAANQILIEVHAVGVTPSELVWYPTAHTKDGGARAGAIPGHEFSGVVAQVGSEIKEFAVGDAVYGMNDWFSQGATAEFCIALPADIAHKPVKLSHAEAAVVPIGALTAWQGLFKRGALKCEDRLLVHGGSGSVGSFVIQLAKIHGVEVIATCSRKNLEFVRSLGVDTVIDYQATLFEHVASHVDVIFDTVGGDTLARSWDLLGASGRMVTIAAVSETASDARTQAAFFIVEPDHQQLTDVRNLIDAGALRSFLGASVGFEDAADAYSAKLSRGAGHGKTAIVISSSSSPSIGNVDQVKA